VNNADIKPWTARSVTARLEYYFEGIGQVSVGAFRRDFENFFGNTTFPATPAFLALYDLDPNTYGAFDVATQHNIQSTVRMTGVDVSYKQALTFLPHWARGIHVFANGATQRAIGDGSANFSGFVPRKASWGISLSREKFTIRMNSSYQGRARRGQVNPGNSVEPGTFDWASKRGFVDLLGEYYFRKQFALYFNLRNVRNTPEDFAVEGPSTPAHAQFRSRESAGSLWTFGVRGTF
jgi:outer membrane receptor protein involved in Fe transport